MANCFLTAALAQASLLHCSDAGLRSAAARQLQRRSWVPQAEAEATPSPAQETGREGAAQGLLGRLINHPMG